MIPSLHEQRRRLGQIAARWIELRAVPEPTNNWEYQQSEHWFRCLVWVTGFERHRNEHFDDFLERVRAELAVE